MTHEQIILGLVILNAVQAIGWGWTLTWSMKRALIMYEFGRVNGVEQGIHQGRAQARAKKSKRKR